MRLVLLGPPGAGKGTQAMRLAQEYGFLHISTGDILRDHAARDTELGRAAKAHGMEEGKLIPDSIVVEMVVERLGADDASDGFILDGFPRTLPQAEALDAVLTAQGKQLTAVIDLALSDGVVLARLEARVQCAACKTPYNLVMSPPAVVGVCDRCGGTLVPRNDDKEAKVRRRLQEYHEAIPALKSFYEERGLFRQVEADASTDEVAQRVKQALAE